MSDTEFTEEEIKAIGLKDAVDSDVLQYMEEKYGTTKGAAA